VRLRWFRDGEALRRLVTETGADAVIVGYWELLEHLPDDAGVPVIADLLAPRFLESLFQPQRAPADEAGRMLRLYRRADRFLCGSERQKHWLLPWLLLAGFQVEATAPIDVIPLSSAPLARRPARAPGPWRLITGGVAWPWRRTERWMRAITHAVDDGRLRASLLSLSGPYVYERAELPPAPPPPRVRARGVQTLPLLRYADMVRLFRRADVGIELADRNVEREYSLSFRSIEWLRCGVPIVCNDYLELADAVRAYDAGWAVSSPEAAVAALGTMTAAQWRRKSVNALRLARDRFHYRSNGAPLLRYLRQPSRPRRGPALVQWARASPPP
jgi:hypothetical protein